VPSKYFKCYTAALALAVQPLSPAHAETIAELDMMAEVAVDEQKGILFAQDQASRGEFLEAIGTLERVLALHPKSSSARLLHAVYLCQIDDQQGGAVEIGKLKKSSIPDELWADAHKLCPLAGKE